MTQHHDKDITLWSAQALLAAYAARTLSPVEVVEKTFDRIDALDPSLRMFTWTDRAAALAQARTAEAAWRNGTAGALGGVTFSVKDTLAVGGVPQTFGSALFRDHVPAADNPVVARLRQAGAVFLGMTNMPEFGQRPTNENALYGTGRNPWNPAHTPGGSSGGSAAAVAVGAGAISIGTDAGGSVRAPAACCGSAGSTRPRPSCGAWRNASSTPWLPVCRLAATPPACSGKHSCDGSTATLRAPSASKACTSTCSQARCTTATVRMPAASGAPAASTQSCCPAAASAPRTRRAAFRWPT